MKIEKNVPIPNRMQRGEWDFVSAMEIGDCIFFDTQREALRCRDAMRYRGLKYKMRRVHKRSGLDSNGQIIPSKAGWRVWRVDATCENP
jgi:hypothetical protein